MVLASKLLPMQRSTCDLLLALLTIAFQANKYTDALIFMLLLTPFCQVAFRSIHDYFKMMLWLPLSLNCTRKQGCDVFDQVLVPQSNRCWSGSNQMSFIQTI
jgi:hypothetical protein